MRLIISDECVEAFIEDVRMRMADGKHTYKTLAHAVKCSERVIGKLLAGERIHNNYIASIAKELKLNIDDYRKARENPERPLQRMALEEYGAYSEGETGDFAGIFLAYRRIFDHQAKLCCSAFRFAWSDLNRRLEFYETQRFPHDNGAWVTNSHKGAVYISRRTRLVHFTTRFQGAVRLMTLHQPRIGEGVFRGLVCTQTERALYYLPAVSAIFLEPYRSEVDEQSIQSLCGHIDASHPDYERLNDALAAIEVNSIFLAREVSTSGSRPQLAVFNSRKPKS